MKYISLILIFLYNTILLSCQNSKSDLNFIKELDLPYTIEIKDYDKFINESLKKGNKTDYTKLSNILGKQPNITQIQLVGKFTLDKQEYILYQDVTPNESSEFFPSIYITKIGNESKTFCLTPTTEESYIDKIIISNNKIILRENYWNSDKKVRKNDRLKAYDFDFNEINIGEKKEVNISNHQGLDQFIKSKSIKDSLILDKDCDINLDNVKDKILVFSPKNANIENAFSKVYVLLLNKDGSFKEYSNNKIINSYNPNSYAEGFQDIVIKNNYFTIEENIASQPIQDKYTTFTYDKKNNSIYLHKIGFSTIYPDASQDKSTTYSSKDLGVIKFENYDPMLIKY